MGISLQALDVLNEYWENVRAFYQPFESGQLSGSSDVYLNEIPGGQYTNLLFQSKQLGLDGQFGQVKSAYAQANLILGDIPKVTPSSKVVGDLAQFMVANKFTKADEVREKAAELSFPDSVVGYLQGNLGTPPGGWESDPKLMAFRLAVLGARKIEPMKSGTVAANTMAPYDFEKAKDELVASYGARMTSDDVLSNAMYPAVFQEWQTFKEIYGSMETMPTHAFLRPLEVGQEVEMETEPGRKQYVKLASISPLGDGGPATSRMVTFEVNGERWFIRVSDDAALAEAVKGGGAREKKTAAMGPGAVGAPMPGAVVKVGVKEGDTVKKGETLFTLSAMKMETAITATMDGTVEKVTVTPGDTVEGDDLLAMITE